MHGHIPHCLIEQYRLHCGLEREALAEASGVSLDRLALFEWDWTYPTLAVGGRLAEGFAQLTGATPPGGRSGSGPPCSASSRTRFQRCDSTRPAGTPRRAGLSVRSGG